jgi:hypothetical protein
MGLVLIPGSLRRTGLGCGQRSVMGVLDVVSAHYIDLGRVGQAPTDEITVSRRLAEATRHPAGLQAT